MGRPKLYHTPEERQEAERRWRANASEGTKARVAAYEATPGARRLARERYARYRETDAYREAQRRYRETARAKATQAAYLRKVRESNPERIKARAAIHVALRSGIIERPAACGICGQEKRLDAHHPLGYAPEHWFTVEWYCRMCHRRMHMLPVGVER